MSFIALLLLAPIGVGCLPAQMVQPRRIDLAVTYLSERSLREPAGQNFWSQGAAIALGTDVYKGWGIAADVSGVHASSIGSSNIPLSLVTAVFGPCYRWHAGHRLSMYGEGLVGEANGFRGLFPAPRAAQTSANSLAVQAGGGIDYGLSGRFAIRLLDAAWLRTQLPNSTSNVQNNLRLGAGIVVRFGH